MNKIKLSTKDLLITIPDMSSLFKYLNSEISEYNDLINYLRRKKHINKKEGLKTASEIQKDLKIKSSVFKKNLDQIYYDMLKILSRGKKKLPTENIECVLL